MLVLVILHLNTITSEGKATILEVSYSLVFDDKKKNEQVEKLKADIDALNAKSKALDTASYRITVSFTRKLFTCLE